MSKNPIISILDQRLNGPNYLDWLRSLKLVLTVEGRLYVLDERPPASIPDTATDAEKETYEAWKKDDTHARCYMIASMVPALARKYESHLHAFDIKSHLDTMYSENIRASRYATTKELTTSRLGEGASVHEHCLKMITLLEKLVNLNVTLLAELSFDLIVLSLPSSYESFIVNFNISKLDPPLDKLMNMLVSFESTIKKEKSLLIDATSGKKSSLQKKRKERVPFQKYKFEMGECSWGSKAKVSKQADDACHHCGKKGHWLRNCNAYLNKKRSEKANEKK